MAKSDSVDETYMKVLSAAMELDLKKGHLKWTLSDLSRKSKVTRSLIYYYFGRSKDAILNDSVKLIGDELIGLSDQRLTLWEKGDIASSIREARAITEKFPFICPFYIQHRGADTEVGGELRRAEKKYLDKIAKFFPHAEKKQIKALFALFWGLCFAPGIEAQTLQEAINVLKKALKS